jgi:hypothetical protein
MIGLFEKIWTAFSPYQAQVLAFLLTLTGTTLAYFFRSRVKLIYGNPNNSFHKLKSDTGPVNIYCEKHYVQNVGRKAAERVEIAFSQAPSELSVFSPRSFERIPGDDGQMIVRIPYLAPRELLIVDTIHVNSPTAQLIAVHCSESVGKKVNFWVLRKLRPSVYWFWLGVALLGLFYAVQLLISFAALLFRATP